MIGAVIAISPGAGIENGVPILLQSATTAIEPIEIVKVGGRRSVTNAWPPMLSILQRPERSGWGSTGRVSTARVPSSAVRINVRSSGLSQAVAWSRNAANLRSLAAAAAAVAGAAEPHLPTRTSSRPGDCEMMSVEPVKGRITAATTRSVIEEAACAEIHPAFEALEIFVVDTLDRPLPAQGIDSFKKGAVVHSARRRREWRGIREGRSIGRLTGHGCKDGD